MVDKESIHKVERRESKSFSCCTNQNDHSNSESASTDGDDSIVLDCSQGNNNNIFHALNDGESDGNDNEPFPRRDPIDIGFHGVRYNVKSFGMNLRKVGFGKLSFFF